MIKNMFLLIALLLALTSAVTAATSEFSKQFEKDYKALDAEILKYISDKIEVTDFVYQKDLATFTFKSGTFYLLRHIKDRPTAAIFIGEGNCRIAPEIPNDRHSLEWCSGKETVDEDFESCFIRFADDLDLLLGQFPTKEHKITWREFNTYKQAQGEHYFRPTTFHEYDNYFQLLRSAYERQVDGYFWVDFNRYVYKYDPALPEPVVISYEHKGGQLVITDVISMSKLSEAGQTNYSMSNQNYPTTLLARSGMMRLGGMAGQNIDEAAIDLQIQVNFDSLKFVSLFLHYNLDIDSIIYKGQQCDYWRRGDFTFLGLVLPEYRQAGETIDLTLHYHGKQYSLPLPYVKNPTPSITNFDLYGQSDFDYFLPGKGVKQEAEGRFNKYSISSEHPYRHFYFQAVSDGFDTLVKITSSGNALNFLKSDRFTKRYSDLCTPDEKYENALIQAYEFMAPRLGELPTSEELFIYPDSFLSMPGLIELKQLVNYDDLTGELSAAAGMQVAKQWFGVQMKPASDRERWCGSAFTDYIGLRSTLEHAGAQQFFTQLVMRRQVIERTIETDKNMPPGAGDRASVGILTAKGSWMVHMLRFLMFDPAKSNEIDFLKFTREFAQTSNKATFTNQDLAAIAEKYYGQSLTWFFDQWLFDYKRPEYKGKWSTSQRDGVYYVTLDLNTTNIAPDYTMPVWIRVTQDNKNSYLHETTIAGHQTLELGPFATEPTDLIFNEFLSVLCKNDVSKK